MAYVLMRIGCYCWESKLLLFDAEGGKISKLWRLNVKIRSRDRTSMVQYPPPNTLPLFHTLRALSPAKKDDNYMHSVSIIIDKSVCRWTAKQKYFPVESAINTKLCRKSCCPLLVAVHTFLEFSWKRKVENTIYFPLTSLINPSGVFPRHI